MTSKAFESANIGELISTSATAVSVGLLIWIAVQDIRYQRIGNRAVLALLLLYLPAQGGFGFPNLASDFLAGSTLFGIGFLLWLVRALGAGDAKLMFPLGLLMGIDGLPIFAVALLFGTVLFTTTSRLSIYFNLENSISTWLRRCRDQGETPYAPLLVVASISALITPFFSSS
ncbi:prepilin peptidase [Tritonibacter multivorans]|uniref:prepilin peptidase n=1 Tax=Tritonibacter multivorans TaxID=928856 RepID=UPI00071D7AC1|nr:A24 family peptidase [Tritonibacter multivorans]MDA7422460.1 A24 family peptidase [Tritonibacter multivorans]